jgi:hypothetical protein
MKDKAFAQTLMVFVGVTLGFIAVMSICITITSKRGDMNNDGVLNITDLSILAVTINEAR